MKKSRNILIAMIVGIGLGIVLTIISLGIRDLINPNINWQVIEAIAALLGVLVAGLAFGGIFIGLEQMKFEAWIKAQEIWTGKEFTKARENIFVRYDNHNEKWDDREYDEAKWVCSKMDEFARLEPHLTREKVMEVWGVPLTKAWLILEDIVREVRENDHWPEKWLEFEKLGVVALKIYPYVKDNRPPKRVNSEGIKKIESTNNGLGESQNTITS